MADRICYLAPDLTVVNYQNIYVMTLKTLNMEIFQDSFLLLIVTLMAKGVYIIAMVLFV